MLAVPIHNRVRELVGTLKKRTFKQIDHEIKDLVKLYGEDVRYLYISCLVDEMKFHDRSDGVEQMLIHLINQELSDVIKKPNFITLLDKIIGISKFTSAGLLERFVELLKMPVLTQLAVCLTACHCKDQTVASEGLRYLRAKLPDVSNLGHLSQASKFLVQEVVHFLRNEKEITDSVRDRYITTIFPELKSVVRNQRSEEKASLAGVSYTSVAQAMKDLGPRCTESRKFFSKVLTSCPRPAPADLAQAIGMMALSPSPTLEKDAPDMIRILEMSPYARQNPIKGSSDPAVSWDLEVFVEGIREVSHSGIWSAAYQMFDYPDFYVASARGFDIILEVFKKATGDSPFPASVFLQKWNNRIGQLSVLVHAVSKEGFFVYSEKIVRAEGFLESKSRSSWRSLDLVETLFRLGETDQQKNVWEVLRIGLKEEPETLLLAALQLPALRSNTFNREVLMMLLPPSLWNYPKTAPILTYLWGNHAEFIQGEAAKLYLCDKSFGTKLLEILNGIGKLENMLNHEDTKFTIDFAMFAYPKEKLDLWLKSKITELRDAFIVPCIDYLKAVRDRELRINWVEEVKGVSSIFRCLMDNAAYMAQKTAQEFEQLYQSSVGQANANSRHEETQADIEKKAHLYFKKIYEGKISLDEVISTLKEFKTSKDPKDSEMYACMIHALFDEYKFFGQYPEKELRITAVLFGLLIKHRVVYNTTLGIALRLILDALQQKPSSNVFQFGIWALQQFKERLHQWPQYCALIVAIPHLRQNHPALVSYVEASAHAEKSDAAGGKPGDVNLSGQAGALSKGQETKTKEAEEALKTYDVPTEKIRDKLHFLINNLSKANLKDKAEELKKVLMPEFFEYFSHFLVTRRVEQEANHLQMYSEFIGKYGDKKLYKVITKHTYKNINVLLTSEKTVQRAEGVNDRKNLKNLGSWLGLMTLARNKPILAKQMRLKELVLQACADGRLIAIIPFVTKVLEPTVQSKIFKPPNPWLMAILALLREVMEVENLKLNLKFAIECLFNHLKLELKSVQPTKALIRVPVHSQNLKPTEQSLQTQQVPTSANKGDDQSLQVDSSQADSSQGAPTEEGKDSMQFVKIHPSIPLFQNYPDLKRCVPPAVDRAIQDIIPVVERSVQIACVTTRQLIMKDFASERDVNVIRRAAHKMVKKLTSSLALVTCKDPLRVSITNNLASRLEEALGHLPSPERDVEHACVQVSADNLELGCRLVEKAASERAVYDIDDILGDFYQRKRTGTPSANNFAHDLPVDLKPEANGMLSPTQKKVYDDFGSQRLPADLSNAGKVDFNDGSAAKLPNHVQKRANPMAKRNQHPSNQTVLDNLMTTYNALKKALLSYPSAKDIPVANLPKTGHKSQEIHKMLNMFPSTLQAARDENIFPKEVMYLTFAKEVFRDLFEERSNALTISAQCAILHCVVTAHPSAVDRITEWLFAAEDAERKFVKPVIVALVGNQIVDVRVVDEYFRKALIQNLTTPSRDNNQMQWRVLDLCIALVRDLVIKEQLLPLECFRNIVEVILRLPKSHLLPFESSIQIIFDGIAALRPELAHKLAHHDTKEAKSNTDDSRFKIVDVPVPSEEAEQPSLRRSAGILLDDWFSICLQGTVSDKTYAQYLQILRNEGLLQTTKSTNLFFRLIIELCIDYSSKSPSQSMSYTTIDALAKLVVFLVKFLDSSNKIALLSSFLQVAAHVLIRDHNSKNILENSSGETFNQKPYLRLFTNLLYDLNTPDPSLDSSNIDVLNAFTHAFHTLRPSRVPGFAFAWMELISHRMFMPKLLISKPRRCSIMFKTLIVDLLEFLHPYLQNADLVEQIRLMYKGTLRILLVLLHDFPEFLCEFHFSFCDAIPTTCIQMRNLVLSAFPRNVRLPDPLTPNLKVDLLPEITHPPKIGCNVTEALVNSGLLRPLDEYLTTRQPASFRLKLSKRLQGTETKLGFQYDLKLINSLILHLGMQGIEKLQSKNDEGIVSQFQDNACMDIFDGLMLTLDPEGRYYVLNAIANQLRYPNNHTHYFSCVLLFLFLHSEDMFVKEQITRVLLERLIVHQPHPWGLLITFIELIKNPQYDFGRQPFTNCAPEIARLFDSVTRSCMPSHEERGKRIPDGVDQGKVEQ